MPRSRSSSTCTACGRSNRASRRTPCWRSRKARTGSCGSRPRRGSRASTASVSGSSEPRRLRPFAATASPRSSRTVPARSGSAPTAGSSTTPGASSLRLAASRTNVSSRCTWTREESCGSERGPAPSGGRPGAARFCRFRRLKARRCWRCCGTVTNASLRGRPPASCNWCRTIAPWRLPTSRSPSTACWRIRRERSGSARTTASCAGPKDA